MYVVQSYSFQRRERRGGSKEGALGRSTGRARGLEAEHSSMHKNALSDHPGWM